MLASIDSGAAAMNPEMWHMLARGLGIAFVAALIFMFVMPWLKDSAVDLGYLGLLYLLTLLLFLVAFSFVVAAATPGWTIKVAVTLVNTIFAFGSKLVGKDFLDYLTDPEPPPESDSSSISE